MKIFCLTSILYLLSLHFCLLNFILFFDGGGCFLFLYRLHTNYQSIIICSFEICSIIRFCFLKIDLGFRFAFYYHERSSKDRLFGFSLQNIHRLTFCFTCALELLKIGNLFSILEYFQINFLIFKN
jgi:hypothetical protein